MKETKDQTIERLKAIIAEQKEELTQVKKDRKRLNYAVERLEREKKKALHTSTPYDIELICEFSDELQEQKKQTEELNSMIAQKEEQYNALLAQYDAKIVDEEAIREQIWGDKNKFKILTMEQTVEKIVGYWDGMYYQSWDDRTYLKRFNEGKRYWLYGDDDERIPFTIHPMFSKTNLLIQIHPDKGRQLSIIDKHAILHYIKNNRCYCDAMKELNELKSKNPNITEEELVEWTYHKGMELLPLYRDKIF